VRRDFVEKYLFQDAVAPVERSPVIATATNNSITGVIALMFRSCAGTGREPPGSNDLRLTKYVVESYFTAV
jgi:hypothetical protein